MELYTLDSGFRKANLIESYRSAIWTERFQDAGDITLVVDDTPANRALLKEDVPIGEASTQEVMLLDTVSAEDGKITVTGSSLLGFLNERVPWRAGNSAGMLRYLGTTDQIVTSIVEESTTLRNDPARADSVIPGLYVIGASQPSPEPALVDYAAQHDYVLTMIKDLVQGTGVGIRLWLTAVSDTAYTISFSTYFGRDLTSSQSTNPVVQFSPALDSLTSVKELRSVKGYKNIAHVFLSRDTEDYGSATSPILVSAPGGPFSAFKRREMLVYADDVKAMLNDDPSTPVTSLMTQRGVDALANNNYTRIVDGEIVPQVDAVFGVNYFMGDIVELMASDGLKQRARITELIRTRDKTGERSYPTVSVIG